MRTANLCLENGDDLRTQMPTLAAHAEARAGAAEVDGAAPRLADPPDGGASVRGALARRRPAAC